MNKLSQILLEYDYEININRNWNQLTNNAMEEQKRIESIINRIAQNFHNNSINITQLSHIYVYNSYDIPITYRLLPDKIDINNYNQVIIPQSTATTDDLNLTQNTTDINANSLTIDEHTHNVSNMTPTAINQNKTGIFSLKSSHVNKPIIFRFRISNLSGMDGLILNLMEKPFEDDCNNKEKNNFISRIFFKKSVTNNFSNINRVQSFVPCNVCVLHYLKNNKEENY